MVRGVWSGVVPCGVLMVWSGDSMVWCGDSMVFSDSSAFYIKSKWGSAQNVLMIILYWSEEISRNYAYLLPNKTSIYTVKNHFAPMTCIDLELIPRETYDVT